MSTKDAIAMQCSAVGRRMMRAMSVVGFAALVATGGVVLSACGGGGDATPAPLVVGTLTISPSAPTIPATKTTKLTAEVKSTSGVVLTDRKVTWSSGSPTIAGVTDSGMVTGVGVGSALITATSEGKTATVSIKITADPCEISGAVPIVANVLVSGTLSSATDCDLEDGSFLDAYNFVLPASTNVDILMRSTAFDSYLVVVRLDKDSLVTVGVDNNSGGGNDARLTGVLTAGSYYILSIDFNIGGLGAYTLLLTSPFVGLRAESSLFNAPANSSISMQHLTAGQAKLLRRMIQRK